MLAAIWAAIASRTSAPPSRHVEIVYYRIYTVIAFSLNGKIPNTMVYLALFSHIVYLYTFAVQFFFVMKLRFIHRLTLLLNAFIASIRIPSILIWCGQEWKLFGSCKAVILDNDRLENSFLLLFHIHDMAVLNPWPSHIYHCADGRNWIEQSLKWSICSYFLNFCF